MKIIRMVIGIISIVLCVLIMFQSCAVGVGNTLAESGEISGTAGLLLAVCMLVAGIVSVAARKSFAGTIVSVCFYAVGALLAAASAGTYTDLKVWSAIAGIFAVILLITAIMQKAKGIKEL